MRKKLLFAPLWGIFTLSLLSSCRTEDGAITQKQIEDKRFSVLIPKSGKSVSYADGFAFLMKRYDNVHGTNISGINNTTKANLNASVNPLFQNIGSHVEFRVRSYVMTEENGEKWIIFPRVENNQVIGLIMCTLKEKETFIAFDEIKSDSDYYKQLLPLFQEAFNRYNRRKGSLALNASIKPMAIGGGGETENPVEGCGDDVQQCGSIEEVVVPGKPNKPKDPPSKPVGASSCDSLSQCPPPTDEGGGGGGGGYFPTPKPNQEIINNLKDYPCAQKLLEQLPSLNNSLAKLIEVAFKSNKKANVTFNVADFNDPLLQGEFKDKTTEEDKINGVLTYQIELSRKILKNSTQEYVLGVMYHEFVHAYLGYEFKRLGPDEYHRQYPYIENYVVGGVTKFRFITGDHQAYGPFINMIADAIQSYNPKFPRDRAIAIAMEGLTKNELPNNGEDYNTIERYSGDTAVGTKCSKP
ncbi:hypothetical protein [Elizabethkingia ursingii]